jgi:hypothetical protein
LARCPLAKLSAQFDVGGTKTVRGALAFLLVASIQSACLR